MKEVVNVGWGRKKLGPLASLCPLCSAWNSPSLQRIHPVWVALRAKAEVKKAWEEQPSPFPSFVEYVPELQSHIELIGSFVREHMEQPQMTQQSEYNHLAQSCEFQPGDQVLLLDPSPNCKFLVCCSVPYTVTGKVVPVNYHLQLPSK